MSANILEILASDPLGRRIQSFLKIDDIINILRVSKRLHGYYCDRGAFIRYLGNYGVDTSIVLPEDKISLIILSLLIELKNSDEEGQRDGRYPVDYRIHPLLSEPYVVQMDQVCPSPEGFIESDPRIVEISSRNDRYNYMDEVAIGNILAAYPDYSNLIGVNLGNYDYTFNELTWTSSVDIQALLSTYQDLFFLYFKSAYNNTILLPITCNNLIYLGIESAGIPKEMTSSLMKCYFPNLLHLEIWLGCQERGGDTTPDQLQPLFDGVMCPKIKRIDIKNTEIISEFIPYFFQSKILDQLTVLDFSLGCINSKDISSLLQLVSISKLRKLIIFNSFIPEDDLNPLIQACQSKNIFLYFSVADDVDGDFRYITVSE